MMVNENLLPPLVSVSQPEVSKKLNDAPSNSLSLTASRSTTLAGTSQMSDTGIVFAFGNFHSQQSIDAKAAESNNLFSMANAFLPLKFFLRDDFITSVACGDEHSAFISNNGRVFTIGRNNMGQLGLADIPITQTITRPRCIKALKDHRVYRVGCGAQHTLLGAISKDGKKQVFAFGMNNNYQLGLGRTVGEMGIEPKPIESLEALNEEVSMLSGGRDHSAALFANHKLFVWGSGPDGQLGLGEPVIESDIPVELNPPEGFNGFTAVSCGYYHTLVITAPPALFACGEAQDGKLGVEPDNHSDSSIMALKQVFVGSAEEHVVAVSAGGNHSLTVTSRGHVYAMGLGTDGQLGVGTSVQSNLLTPTLLKTFSDAAIFIKSVSAGDLHSAFVTDDGKLFLCGNALHNRLGFDISANTFNPRIANLVDEPSGLDTHFGVTSIACGGCHTVCLANKLTYAQALATKPFGDTTNFTGTSTGSFTGTSSTARLERRKRKNEQAAALSLNLPSSLPQTASLVPAKSLQSLPPLVTNPSIVSTAPNPSTISTSTFSPISTLASDPAATAALEPSMTMAMAAALNTSPPILQKSTVANVEVHTPPPTVPILAQIPALQANTPEINLAPVQPVETAPPATSQPLVQAEVQSTPEVVVNPPPDVDKLNLPPDSTRTEEKPAETPKEAAKPVSQPRSSFSLPLICGGKKPPAEEPPKKVEEVRPENSEPNPPGDKGEGENEQKKAEDEKKPDGETKTTNAAAPTKTCTIL